LLSFRSELEPRSSVWDRLGKRPSVRHVTLQPHDARHRLSNPNPRIANFGRERKLPPGRSIADVVEDRSIKSRLGKRFAIFFASLLNRSSKLRIVECEMHLLEKYSSVGLGYLLIDLAYPFWNTGIRIYGVVLESLMRSFVVGLDSFSGQYYNRVTIVIQIS